MSWLSDELVLLRESLGGTVLRFERAHADALLAYPGTLWAEVKEEVHDAAQTVADWSAPAAVDPAAAAPLPADGPGAPATDSSPRPSPL